MCWISCLIGVAKPELWTATHSCGCVNMRWDQLCLVSCDTMNGTKTVWLHTNRTIPCYDYFLWLPVAYCQNTTLCIILKAYIKTHTWALFLKPEMYKMRLYQQCQGICAAFQTVTYLCVTWHGDILEMSLQCSKPKVKHQSIWDHKLC